jgi:competence protein ComEC
VRAKLSPRHVRPVVALLAAVAFGILAAPWLPLASPGLYAGAAICLIAGLSFGGRMPPGAMAALLLLPFALTGAARAREVMTPTPDDVSRCIDGPSLWIRGAVASDVEERPGGACAFTLSASTVYDFRASRPASGLVRVTLRGVSAPAPGDTLWLRGRIESPPVATNPGEFDYRAYLARRGVFSTMLVRRSDDVRAGDDRETALVARLSAAVRAAIERATRTHLKQGDAELMNGLLLSARSQLPAPLDEAFARTGTVHVLSVSGLHMAVLAAFLAWTFRLFAAPRPAASLAAIGLLWLFALASGGSPAALRSALMASFVLAAPLLRRTADPLHALAAAAALLLLVAPGMLYEAGFQLSFAAVGTLLFYVKPLERGTIPWEPGMTWPIRAARAFVTLILVGLVAEAGSAPLVAYHFNRVSLVAPLANVPIALLTEALVLGGLGASALSLLPGPLTAPLWSVLGGGLWLLRGLTEAFAALPWASYAVASPPLTALFLYYALLGGAAPFVRRHVLKKTLFAPPSPVSAGGHSVSGGMSATP